MWLDLIPLGIILYFAVSGAKNGALVAFMRMFALVGSYVAAYALGPVVSPFIILATGTNEFLATLLARALLFVCVFFGCMLAIWVVKRAHREAPEGPSRSALDRTGGGIIGTLQGAVFALLIGILANWVAVGHRKGGLENIPSGGSRIAAASSAILESTADVLLGSEARGARVAVRFAARPDEAIEDVENVLGSPAIRKLQGDTLFWSYLEHGSLDQALNRGTFLELTYDKEMRNNLFELGMITQESAQDPQAFRAEARNLFAQLSPRIRILRQDPAVAELAQDPAILAAVRSGNSIALLTDPRVQAIASRVMEAQPDGGDS